MIRQWLNRRRRERMILDVRRFYPDFSEEFSPVFRKVAPFTMTSPERLYSLYQAVGHITKHNIKGDIVECGVWKGGSCMTAALRLLQDGVRHRSIYLYDTFAGMSQPTDKDVSRHGLRAMGKWAALDRTERNDWCCAGLDEVRRNVESTGYPADRLVYVRGKVEDTLPGTVPDRIALLRLDTDWYESTRHELEYLYPRLERGGILIIDDYGHWEGARRAVDEYIEHQRLTLFLGRVDTTCRLAVKL